VKSPAPDDFGDDPAHADLFRSLDRVKADERSSHHELLAVPIGQAVGISVPFLVLGGIVGFLLWLTAFVQARTTVYTVTNRRVAMRIGAALTVTLNLPYTQIESADLDLRKDGTGSIVFKTMGDVQFSYIMCWPHVRPWKFPAHPALRCIPDAERVARLIGEAAEARVSMPQVERRDAPVAMPAE